MTNRPRVFVTGARRGIGRGIAYEFAANGYDVVINDVVEDEAVAETLAGIAERGGKGRFIIGSIADVASLPAMVDEAFSAFGGLECLVNNAGVQVKKRGDLLDVTPESYDEIMDINLRGTFFMTQEVARRFLKTPSDRPRSIISLASVNATMMSINRGEYCLSKAGVGVMTKLFAIRLGEANIGVFDIRPGIIRTDMTAPVKDTYDKLIAEGITPIRRWGEPEDIGRAAVALASGNFHFSTGDSFHVDGGLHIHRL